MEQSRRRESAYYADVFRLSRASKWTQAIGLIVDGAGGRLRPPFRNDGNQAWYVVGDLFWKSGDLGNALVAFRKAVRAWPSDAEALWAVGNCYSELHRFRMAERYFRRALEISPNNLALAYNLGNCLFDQKRYSEALTAYRCATQRRSDFFSAAKRNMQLAQRALRTSPGRG